MASLTRFGGDTLRLVMCNLDHSILHLLLVGVLVLRKSFTLILIREAVLNQSISQGLVSNGSPSRLNPASPHTYLQPNLVFCLEEKIVDSFLSLNLGSKAMIPDISHLHCANKICHDTNTNVKIFLDRRQFDKLPQHKTARFSW